MKYCTKCQDAYLLPYNSDKELDNCEICEAKNEVCINIDTNVLQSYLTRIISPPIHKILARIVLSIIDRKIKVANVVAPPFVPAYTEFGRTIVIHGHVKDAYDALGSDTVNRARNIISVDMESGEVKVLKSKFANEFEIPKSLAPRLPSLKEIDSTFNGMDAAAEGIATGSVSTNKPTLRPFSLERALAGDPVVTRIGEPAKIHHNPNVFGCQSIIGWVCDDEVMNWYIDGTVYEHKENCNDLFMAPKVREMWVNLYDTDIDQENSNAVWFNTEEEASGKNYLRKGRLGGKAHKIIIEE